MIRRLSALFAVLSITAIPILAKAEIELESGVITGKVLAGKAELSDAYVIARWEANFSSYAMHGGVSCRSLLVTRADSHGNYRIPEWRESHPLMATKAP